MRNQETFRVPQKTFTNNSGMEWEIGLLQEMVYRQCETDLLPEER